MDSPLGYYNPNLRKQGAKTRALAAERSSRKTAEQDPRTFGFMSGLMGDEYGSAPLSVLDPNRAKAQGAQDVGMAVGTALEAIPGLAVLRRPAAKAGKALGKSALQAVNDASLYGDGFLGPLTPKVNYAVEPGPKPKKSTEPFWFNSKTGAYEPMENKMHHAYQIQDPEYAAKLGVTPEQATAYPVAPEAEPLITGRQTGNRLSLVGMGTPTDETLTATQKLLQEKQLAPEIIDFGGGERLWEGMTPDDLLKAKSLEDLEQFKKYKDGGSVQLSRYSKQHIAKQYAESKR